MKKYILTIATCLFTTFFMTAQTVQSCGTYQAREIYLKSVPGYAAKLNAAIAASDAEYQTFLQNKNLASKTNSLAANYTFTVPVVFHILHLGEAPGVGTNVNESLCINALAQVNKDFARQGADTASIDPLYKPLYINSNLHFALAKKDPNGNCTNGIIHHYDPKTNWLQSDLLNYQYSTMAAGNWNPTKYLNVYVVKNIVGASPGIIVAYTHLPGTAPIDPSDAIVYNGSFLSGLDARSLSHEIGHWLGLEHTFGSNNNAGELCADDDIGDTPRTTGYFSTCPKLPTNYPVPPSITNPTDSSDIITVNLENMKSITALNSLTSQFSRDAATTTGTATTITSATNTINGKGTNGNYSDFTDFTYPNDFATGIKTISIKSSAKYTDNNYVGVYIDFNRNGSFTDAGEAVYIPTVAVVNYNKVPLSSLTGVQTYSWDNTPLKINKTYTLSTSPGVTFTTTPDSFVVVPATVNIPSSSSGLLKMRVITSSTPITGPNMTVSSGEYEDYLLNVNLPSCDVTRPNIENIMDYSSCAKMFTSGQTDKMRLSAQSMVASRNLLVDTNNLKFTGILDAAGNPTGPNICAPIADFAANKVIACEGQSIVFNSTSYNATPSSYSWVFEGGTPATSSSASQSVIYSTPGTYSVSLTVSNSSGVSTKTVSSYITTNNNSYGLRLPYSEGFENGALSNTIWSAKNLDFGTVTWEQSNYGSGSSSKSVMLPNANALNSYPNNIDYLESSQFDFSNTTNISFSFDYSFARKTSVTKDTFKLQYSLDCGGSWITLPGSPTALVMSSSGGTVNVPYIPWSSINPNPKWVTKTIPSTVSSILNNKRNVKFRFWFINDPDNGQSQNLYIDNINISGTVGLHEFENSLGISIYPNPTTASSVIEFTSPVNGIANISLYDVAGRMVEQESLHVNSGIITKGLLNRSSDLKPGIYFVNIEIDNKKVTKKIIIQ